MKPTFVTTGDVRREYNDDGTTKCYYVSRTDAEPICTHYMISEYLSEGNHVYIDNYGHPWVRK